MGKKLAIKGHPTHGKEVIELLEMMGGINDRGYIGTNTWKDEYYFLDDGYIRAYDWCDGIKFTLEEFLDKYPFKVGDVVDRTLDYVSCVIDNMRWNFEKCCVEYHLNFLKGGECGWHVSECLYKPDNKDSIIGTKIETIGFMQLGKTVSVCFNKENYENEVELQLGDYEIAVRDGKTYAVLKKPKYPKTYKECCEILMGKTNFSEFSLVPIKYSNTTKFDNDVSPDAPHIELFNNLYEIVICRDAYWKIAGEQMGLGKPWEPDWRNTKNVKYAIATHDDIITKMYLRNENVILAFPSEEMRDVFYENFKDLIEQCKELL